MVSMSKTREELMEEFSDAESPERDVEELINEIIAEEEIFMEVTEYGLTTGDKHGNYTIHFVCVNKEGTASVIGQDVLMTFSYLFIEHGDTKYKIDTDGPFQTELNNAVEFFDSL
jgi:hypothetical protein